MRPYTLTRGRTRSRHPLLVETLISVTDYDPHVALLLTPECRDIYEGCREVRSVAEISVYSGMPLGVVRVLVSDLADQGKVRVHPPAHGYDEPDQELFERVLRGLQALPR